MDAGVWIGLLLSGALTAGIAVAAAIVVRRRRRPAATGREAIAAEARKAMRELRHDADKSRGKARPLNDKGKLDDNLAAAYRWGEGRMRDPW